MAIEYAGYVPSETRVDWEGLTDKFAKKTTDVIKARQGERQALDQIAIDNSKTISDQELGKTQTVNDFIVKSGFKSKDFIANANKELKAGRITPEQYRRTMNNVSSHWGTLANSAKTYDTRRQEILNRQQQDPEGNIAGSSYEIELQRLNEEALDMKNNDLHIGTDGTMYLGKVDPKTGEIIGQLNDVRSLNVPENIMANRVNVNKESNAGVEGWGDFARFTDLGGGADITVEGVYHNPDYKLARQYLVEKIAPDSDPRRQLSVLADNGGLVPEYYFTDKEKESKKQALINQLAKTKSEAGLDPPTRAELDAIELNMVKQVRGGNGIINPELTKEQQAEAKKLASNNIDVVVENKITGHGKEDRYHAPASRDGGDDDGSGSTKKLGYETYLRIKKAFDTSDGDILNSLVPDGRFSFKWDNETKLWNVFEEYSLSDRGDKVFKQRLIGPVKEAIDLSTYFYPEKSEWGDQRQQFAKQKESAIAAGAATYGGATEKKSVYDWTPDRVAYVDKAIKLYKVNPRSKNELKAALESNPSMTSSEITELFRMKGKFPSLSADEIIKEINKK